MTPIPILCGLVAAIIWGTQPTISKLGYLGGLSASDLTFLRYFVSGLLMLPFVLVRGIGDACGLGWPRTLALMLVAGPLYSLVLIGGVKWAPASHGALIYPAFTPVFGALLAQFVFKQSERISVLGLLLLVMGILLVGMENILHATVDQGDAWIGDLLFVLAAFMWALYIGLMRTWKTEPVAVMALIQVGGLAYLPVYLWLNGMTVLHAPREGDTVPVGFSRRCRQHRLRHANQCSGAESGHQGIDVCRRRPAHRRRACGARARGNTQRLDCDRNGNYYRRPGADPAQPPFARSRPNRPA